jgi:hypothetical protein
LRTSENIAAIAAQPCNKEKKMADIKQDFPKHGLDIDPCETGLLSLFPPMGGTSKDPTVPGTSGLHCSSGAGIEGSSLEGDGVVGNGANRNGVVGRSSAASHSGVFGQNTGSGIGVAGNSAQGIGVLGQGGRLAGRFEGDVEFTGDIRVEKTGDIRLENADCAEDFDIESIDEIEPGTVMIINQNGALIESEQAYDKRVAGVISGAGKYKPGIVLDRQQSQTNRMPIALVGKVYCKVDARYGAITAGDLLTTSATPGHAMKADDPLKAFGALVGKALRPLTKGQGLIPILIVSR